MGGRLSSKVALVTGAGSGIGRASALAMAGEGAVLIVTDIDEAGGRETCAMIASAGSHASFHQHDVASEQSWDRVLNGVDALHVLVNNAGICIATPLAQMTYESWRQQFAFNMDGTFLGTKRALPLLAQ